MQKNAMTHRRFAAPLVVALIQAIAFAEPMYGMSAAEKQVRRGEHVKSELTKLQTGQRTRLAVKLRNKTTIVGYLDEVNDYSFLVTDPVSNTSTQVAYTDVRHLSALSTGAKITIGVGIGVAAAIGLYYLYLLAHSQ